jgi:hypothetical protein
MLLNDEALGQAWREKYGENIPVSGRPGPKTDAPKTERVAVLLAAEDMALLDARRGERSRSEFIRQIIVERVRRGGEV